jgi:hypothetical protein
LINAIDAAQTLFNSFFQTSISCKTGFSRAPGDSIFALPKNHKPTYTIMKKAFLILAASAFIFSCTKERPKQDEFTGPQTEVAHGKAWSSVKLDKNGAPQRIVLTIDQGALNTMPTGEDMPGHEHENTMMITLPEKALETTPFKFIMLNWNPEGHEPDGIYDIPHFDMHFYLSNLADVTTYVDNAKLNANPASDYLPANHIGGAPVPQMGKHWIDVTSPELSGATFTQTFIYGSYDSKIVFYEPMITLDFLKTTASFERTLPQPAKFATAGYYPTKMKVYKDLGATNISLEGFVYRQAN